jgi:hypothetical protein
MPREVVATILPCALVERRALGMLVMAKDVAVALTSVVLAVIESVPAFESKVKRPPAAEPKRTVVDALMPDCAKMVDEVAAFSVPKLVEKVNGSAPELVASVPHVRTPAVEALTSQDALLRLETMSAVVDARPLTLRLVVVAFVVDALEAKSDEKVFCAVQVFAA